jgi:myo-inositol 2-dehydrogenase/D-chiro-inositol 1-dehydrogenase
MTHRIGLIGCGRIAERGWIPAIAATAGAELAAVADSDLERCAALAPGLPRYASATDLVGAGGIDAVVVATPAASHLSDAQAAAAGGLPSLVEKPPAQDAAAARLLAGLEPLPSIGFNRRFEESVRDVRDRLHARSPISMKLVFHYRRASWAPHVVADDALLDLGPHLIDLARWLSGSPIRRVRAAGVSQSRCNLELDLDRGTASLSCASDRVYRELVEIRGGDGDLVRSSRGGFVRGVAARLRPTPAPLVDSLAAQLDAFCAGAGDVATAGDGVAVMDAIDAARRSHGLGGTWVEVPAEEVPRLR